MKYAIAIAPLLALAASQSVARQVVDGLTTDTNDLASTISGYSGGSGDDIKSQAAALVTSINAGDARVVAAPALTQSEAIDLATGVNSLSNAVKSAIDAIVGKKSALTAAGQGPAAYSALVAQQSASAQLSKDLTSKVPDSLQSTAEQLAAPIAAALSSGVAAFADQTGAASSGAASATSAPASSAAASSAASSVTSAASGMSSMASSSAAMGTSGSSATASSARPSSTTVVTGGADKVAMTGGAAVVAMLAILAL